MRGFCLASILSLVWRLPIFFLYASCTTVVLCYFVRRADHCKMYLFRRTFVRARGPKAIIKSLNPMGQPNTSRVTNILSPRIDRWKISYIQYIYMCVCVNDISFVAVISNNNIYAILYILYIYTDIYDCSCCVNEIRYNLSHKISFWFVKKKE